jgi:4-carboxymuconolactone decarboxylase
MIPEQLVLTPLLEKGMQNRREVLGAEFADRSLKSVDDFTGPIQQLIIEYCWGAVWSRPQLERKFRCMLNIAMLSAAGRSNEVKLHIRSAAQCGATQDEIREVIMQIAIYCGVPASLDASRIAQEVFRELDATAKAAAD